MSVYTEKIKFKTKGNVDIMDVTNLVDRRVQDSEVTSGLVTVFVPGATGSVTTMEYEPGLVSDLKNFISKLVPEGENYAHNLSHSDANGHSHIRSTLLGPSLVVPFVNKKLQLGIWQQIIFIDFDNRVRERELIVQIIGE
ncbi:MAG: secondary thiamine-phosphate synthase enzyme YjbQ [Candidatus Firestonebacteria bacterium]